MNKLIKNILYTIVILLVILASCTRYTHTKEELIVRGINNLNADILLHVSTNIGEKSKILATNKSDSIIFLNEQFLEVGIFERLEMELDYMVNSIDYNIYNISDTTSIIYSTLHNDQIEQFNKNLLIEDIAFTSYYERTKRETITIDSTLLPIFKKDYGMLELFKEYYKAEE